MQQADTIPSITTVGTERIPSALARLATSIFFISSTTTSQAGQAACRTAAMVSSHAGQPALKISTLRFIRHAESSEPITLSWAVAGGQVGRMVETVHPRGRSKVKGSVHPMLGTSLCPRSSPVPGRAQGANSGS